MELYKIVFVFFFQAEDGIRAQLVTGVQTCALPISPLLRSSILALACSATTIVLSVMAAQAMRGQFRGNGWFFYLMLLGIMAPGILVGFGFAILMRLMDVELSWDTTTFLVQVSWTLPFGFLTMLAVFNRFDKRVEAAALTLGASRLTTF